MSPHKEKNIKENPSAPQSGFHFASLAEHLGELRSIMIHSTVFVSLVFAITYYFADAVVYYLEQPLLNLMPEGGRQLYYLGLGEKFFTYLKVSMYVAMTLSLPFLLIQFWKFVAPALNKREKNILIPFSIAGILAFYSGLMVAYYLIVPATFSFLLHYGGGKEKPLITLTEYFGMLIQILSSTALLFEFPILLCVFAALGLVTEKALIKHRRYAYVGLSIVAAIITPMPDALSMICVMIPLFALYEVSIVCVKILSVRRLAQTPKSDHSTNVIPIR